LVILPLSRVIVAPLRQCSCRRAFRLDTHFALVPGFLSLVEMCELS
jgi:hypothetical protein